MPWIVRLGIERRAHLLDRLQQLRQTFEREELALQRDEDRIRRGHRVDRDEIERRRTIDQHIGVGLLGGIAAVQHGERIAQAKRAIALGAELELEARQIHGRRGDVQPRHRRRQDRFAQPRLADQHVVGRALAVLAIDAEPGRCVALRIEIDDQHMLAGRGQRRAEVDGGGGLADAALLVGERDDARPDRPRLGLRLVKLLKSFEYFVRHGSLAAPLCWRRSSCGKLIDLDDAAIHAGPARMKFRLHSPIFCSFRQFSLYILAL